MTRPSRLSALLIAALLACVHGRAALAQLTGTARVPVGWKATIIPLRPVPVSGIAGPTAAPVSPRSAALATLAAAGLPGVLQSQGLVLWKLNRWTPRSGGERVELTLSLPHDGRPYERGYGDGSRQEELARRIESVKPRVREIAASALNIQVDDATVQGRLIETCCGVGCGSCVLVKPEHAKTWTGQEAREASR